MSRPNWFFGFCLDASFVLDLPPPPSALRLYHPADVHLTLSFLGGCGEEAALRALAALDQRLEQQAPPAFEIGLGDVVPLGGSRRSYSALSALLSTGREDAVAVLTAYRHLLADAAAVRRDERPPLPHVTLARPKRRAGPEDRAAGLAWAEALDLGQVRLRVGRVALFTWSEPRLERLFRVVAERPLA